MLRFKNVYLIPVITFISLLVALYLEEDTLGGGKEDYEYHIKYFLEFSDNFYKAFIEFGSNQESSSVRNSPIFYMIFSIFLKIGISLESLKLINLLIMVPFFIFFFKCLEIKYSQIDLETIDTFSPKNFHKDLFFVKILSSKLEYPIHLTSATLTHKEFEKIKAFDSFKSNKHKTTSRSKDIKFFKKN